MKAQRDADNVSKVCKYRANLRPACRQRRARGGRAEGWGKSCVCVCSAREHASALQRETLEPTRSHSSQPGRYFPMLVSGFRDMAEGIQRTSLEKRDCHHHYLILLQWTMPTSTGGMSSEVKNAPSHFTRRRIKQLQPKVDMPQTTRQMPACKYIKTMTCETEHHDTSQKSSHLAQEKYSENHKTCTIFRTKNILISK